MAKNEKRDCHHCGKRLKQGHQATMVKDGKKYLLHKSCAKILEDEELEEQQNESNVVPLKIPGGEVFGPNKIKPGDIVHVDGNKPFEPRPVVLQRDARILREGLAKVFKMVPPPIQQEINSILGLYALNVAKYCQHPERSFVPMRGCHVCIDCGAGDMGEKF